MGRMYNSAMGKMVDIDGLLLQNEEVIAIGNMKVNARGDLLGPGGKIIKTKDQVMKEYYELNTPTAGKDPLDNAVLAKKEKSSPVATPMVMEAPVVVEPVAKPTPVAAPVVEEPIIISPESGLDDDDEGPVVEAIVDKPIEEVLAAPVVAEVPEDLLPEPSNAFIPPVVRAAATPSVTAPQLSSSLTADSIIPPTAPPSTMRGSLASSVAKSTTVTQKAKLPPNKAGGIQRF